VASRPDLIRGQWAFQRVTVSHRNLLALSPSDLQTGLGVETIHPLVIYHHAGLPQLQIDHPGTVASMTLSERDDLLFQGCIAIRRQPVTE